MDKELVYVLTIPDEFEPILKRLKKHPDLFKKFSAQISKLLREPLLGKPLRNVLRNYRRVHVSSHVLIYEICGSEIRLLDFDHHDRVYKKHK